MGNKYDSEETLRDKYRLFNKIIKKVNKKKYPPFREFIKKLFDQYKVNYDENTLDTFLTRWHLLKEQYEEILEQNGKERIYLKFREVKRVPCKRFKEYRMTLEGYEDISLIYYSPDYFRCIYFPNIFDTIIVV